LGKNTKLTQSQIVWLSARKAFKCKIETSTDNINWILSVDKTQNTDNQATQTDDFNALARYVKITITGGTGTNNRAGFDEFRLFDGSATTIRSASVIINCVKTVLQRW
jgi:hypothetical protein